MEELHSDPLVTQARTSCRGRQLEPEERYFHAQSFGTAVLAGSSLTTAAFAASTTDTGAIKVLDPTTHQVTLADGRVFQVSAGLRCL